MMDDLIMVAWGIGLLAVLFLLLVLLPWYFVWPGVFLAGLWLTLST